MDIVRREQREAFITEDGSTIRELAGIPSGNASNQSLAEAVVPPGSATIAHVHHSSEEIYLFTHGSGRMRLGSEEPRCAPETAWSYHPASRTSCGPPTESR
jgi:mannose-6-phosphate isomerase-like protein (cupin superfamily)